MIIAGSTEVVSGLVQTVMQSFCSIVVPNSGTDKWAVHAGTGRLRTNFVLRLGKNTIVPLTCFQFACSDGNGTIMYRSIFRISSFIVHFFGREWFFLKCFCLIATHWRSTFRNNTERSGTIVFLCERGHTTCKNLGENFNVKNALHFL